MECNRIRNVWNVILVNKTNLSLHNTTVSVLRLFGKSILNKYQFEIANVDNTSIKLLSQTFKPNPEIFATKLKDGLVFNYAAFTYGPYVDIENSNGLELKIILKYCSRHKFICNLTLSHDQWGEIFGNESDRGPLKWVHDGNVDITIGGFYLQGRKLEYVDFVGPTYRLGITCIVPKPSVAINMKIVLQSFDLMLWLLIIATIVIFSLVINGILYWTNLPTINTTFVIFTITLQQSTSHTFNAMPHSKIRNIYFIYMLFTLIMTTAYTSKLYNSLKKSRYENVIKSVEDLENSGYDWGAPHISYIEALANTPEYKHVKLLSRFHTIQEESDLIQRLYKGNFGMLIEKLAHGYMLSPSISSEDIVRFTPLKEDLYWTYTAIMIHKHSEFYDTLKMHVMEVFGSGLLFYWEDEKLRSGNFQVQRVLAFIREKNFYPLSFTHVEGILCVWLIGLVIATCCFFLEMYCYHKKKCI